MQFAYCHHYHYFRIVKFLLNGSRLQFVAAAAVVATLSRRVAAVARGREFRIISDNNRSVFLAFGLLLLLVVVVAAL